MRLAYITATFPSVTETFVLRETNYYSKKREVEELFVFAYKKPVAEWINTENIAWLSNTIYTRKRYIWNLYSFFSFCIFNLKAILKIFKIWKKEVLVLSLKNNLRLLVHILTAFGVAKSIQIKKIDHMHAHFSTASTIALIVNILTGTPFSFTAHASADIYEYSPFLLKKIKLSKKIIAISQYNKNYLELISNYQIDNSKIEVIYNGVHVPEKMTLQKNNTPPIIFMSAAFTGFKGYGTLIKAFLILIEKGITFKFYSVGGGPLLNIIKKMIKEKGMDEQVELLGIQPFSVVEEFLAKADIFVFPSEININGQRDGMPTAITEAMAYSLPIVATYISGIPEQIVDGYNGFLVPERNEIEIADKLEKLISDEKLRCVMGERSYQIASEKFNSTHNLDKLSSIILNKK